MLLGLDRMEPNYVKEVVTTKEAGLSGGNITDIQGSYTLNPHRRMETIMSQAAETQCGKGGTRGTFTEGHPPAWQVAPAD